MKQQHSSANQQSRASCLARENLTIDYAMTAILINLSLFITYLIFSSRSAFGIFVQTDATFKMYTIANLCGQYADFGFFPQCFSVKIQRKHSALISHVSIITNCFKMKCITKLCGHYYARDNNPYKVREKSTGNKFNWSLALYFDFSSLHTAATYKDNNQPYI